MTEVSTFPVIAVDAWTRTCLGERGGGQPAPALTWRDRRFIERLQEQGKIDIRELRTGLEIVTKSHVGYLPFERFGLRIDPAISHRDMRQMMRYAYELDDFDVYNRSALAGITDFAPEELIILGLVFHVRKLAGQGLFQAYVEEDAELATIRGSVRFAELATRFRLGGTLPCRYERRTPDVLVNQLLAGGLIYARKLTQHHELLRELERLRTFLEEHVNPVPLTEDAFRTVEREMTRLNEHYRPAIDLCYLLYEQGSLDERGGNVRHFPGFLLDMNRLFERFIGRLLRDITPRKYRVEKQSRRSFYTAPPGHTAPVLRPDFRIVDVEGRVSLVVDAKYKLLDERSIDVSDLYQLTIYGMADDPSRGSVIALYPASHRQDPYGASDRLYHFAGPNRRRLNVIFRGVRLSRVWAALTSPEGRAALYNELLRTDF